MRSIGLATLLATTLLVAWSTSGTAAQATQARGPLADRLEKERDNAELQRTAPFKVFDNVYYVGAGWVASWLVTTSDGLILIDTLEERYADHAIDGITKLGFDPKNLKYVLVLQGHADHLGGVAMIQEKYGARVAMAEGDWTLVEQPPGGRGGRFRAPKRDVVVKDGQTLTLGDTTLRLYVTPGHTPGTTSIDMTVRDGARSYRTFFFGGSAAANNVPAIEQFLATLTRLEPMVKGAQVRLVNHGSSDPDFWARVDKLAQRRPGDPHPFVIGPDVFPKWLDQLRAEATEQLAQAKARAATPRQ